MFKRRHSMKTVGVVNEEKRRKRWTQCLALKNLQKLAAATGLCCYKQKSTPSMNTTDADFARPHPVLRRTATENSAVFECDSSSDEDLRGDTLQSRTSDVSLCSREDNVQKSIECPLNDAQLQRDLSRVADRLNYLLNLSENGNNSEDSCPTCQRLEPAPLTANGQVPFTASWDEISSSLSIRLVPATRSRSCINSVPRLERLDSGLGSGRHVLAPCSAHRRLSARTSTDSGFFNHQNDVMSQNSDAHEDKEKRPSSPYVATKTVKSTRKMVREFRPISEVSGVQAKNINKDIVKKWRKIPTYGVTVSNSSALGEELKKIDMWGGVDVFKVAKLSNNRPLTCIMFTICKKRDMFNKFKIQQDKFLTYIMTLEDHYRDISYHNRIHAADVAQSVHSLLSIPSLTDLFSDLEILSALIASAIHDVDHPGVSNQYHCSNYTELALIYNDTSVLEMHHLAVGFKLMMQDNCNLFEQFTRKQWQLFRKMIVDMVLATDMTKHMHLVANLKTMVETKKVASSGVLELDQYIDRIEVLKNLVHCADLSNPIKPIEMYKEWTNRIMAEYWAQGDVERELGAEISPMCDRQNANVEKSQVMFIDFVVYPLVEIWAELVSPHAQDMLVSLTNNREYYANHALNSPSPTSEKKSNAGTNPSSGQTSGAESDNYESDSNDTYASAHDSLPPNNKSSITKWLFSGNNDTS